ncbi:MAG TPA: hypothetical protein VLE91_04555 [Candidatus Saccharimonadales bacterium]|nr:hypothetical protein [Candidatus Saccharimonadales bacterium]
MTERPLPKPEPIAVQTWEVVQELPIRTNAFQLLGVEGTNPPAEWVQFRQDMDGSNLYRIDRIVRYFLINTPEVTLQFMNEVDIDEYTDTYNKRRNKLSERDMVFFRVAFQGNGVEELD